MAKWWQSHSLWQKLLPFILISSYLGLSGFSSAATAGETSVVSLTIDGHKQVVSSDAPTVGEVLRRAQAKLGPNDLVEPEVSSEIDAAVFYINVYKAKPAVVVDGEREYYVDTPYQNPKLIAQRSAGIKLHPQDGFRLELIRDFATTPAVGQRVVIERSRPLVIVLNGKVIKTRTQAQTVGELLDEKGIEVDSNDTLNFKQDHKIEADMRLIVNQVGTQKITREEVIPRPVRYIYDGSRNADYEKVDEEGSDGRRLVTYRVVRHGKKIVRKKELKVVVLAQPTPKVIVRGVRRTAVAGADWSGLRQCESGGDYHNKHNPLYRGAYQFSYATWASMGGSGDPADAPPEEQDFRASMLYKRSGRNQWPVCGPRYLP